MPGAGQSAPPGTPKYGITTQSKSGMPGAPQPPGPPPEGAYIQEAIRRRALTEREAIAEMQRREDEVAAKGGPRRASEDFDKYVEDLANYPK